MVEQLVTSLEASRELKKQVEDGYHVDFDLSVSGFPTNIDGRISHVTILDDLAPDRVVLVLMVDLGE